MTAPANANPLDQLRDIHLPEAVSAWPPAIGWWLIAIIVVLAVVTTAVIHYRRYQSNAYRRAASLQLAEINQLRINGDYSAYLQQLNQLLKQTALSVNEQAAISSLSGKAWLSFLDNSGNTSAFTTGAGTILEDGPYRQNTGAGDFCALHQLAGQWIKEHQTPC